MYWRHVLCDPTSTRWTRALVGDRRLAFSRLAETETALSKADNRRNAVGGYDHSAFEFHRSSVLYTLGPASVMITTERTP